MDKLNVFFIMLTMLKVSTIVSIYFLKIQILMKIDFEVENLC